MTPHAQVGSICWPSEYVRGCTNIPEFIQCVIGRLSQMHEVWDFGFDRITCEVHIKAQVDVSDGVVGYLFPNYLTESGRRVPILSQIPINGSVKYLGTPDFHKTWWGILG